MDSHDPAPASPIRRTVRCPACGGDSVYAATNPFRPFCSARCKNADFGAWASESYRVSTSPGSEDAQIEEPSKPH